MSLLSWLSKCKNSSAAAEQPSHSSDTGLSTPSSSHSSDQSAPSPLNHHPADVNIEIGDCCSDSEQLGCNSMGMASPSTGKTEATCLFTKPALRSQRLSFPSQPHQPKLASFPKRNYGKQKRSFVSAWYEKYHWIHYNEQDDSVLCHYCMTAEKRGLLKAGNTCCKNSKRCYFHVILAISQR